MYSTVLNPSHSTRIRWQAALTVVITTLLLLLVAEKPGAAQVGVGGVIPGFGTVTGYRNEPDFFQLQIKGGRWPQDLNATQIGMVGFRGFWNGSIRFEGDWFFTGSRLFSYTNMSHENGPLIGESVHVPQFGTDVDYRYRRQHDSVFDWYQYRITAKDGLPDHPAFIMEKYTYTLSVYHGVASLNGAPEPGTLWLVGAGLIFVGLVVRRYR